VQQDQWSAGAGRSLATGFYGSGRSSRCRRNDPPLPRRRSHTTRDFEDLAGWLAKRSRSRRWRPCCAPAGSTVHAIVGRLVDTHLDTDRLHGLYRIGVDEIAYRKGRKFLTVVTDHDTGRVVWIGDGRSGTLLSTFFDQLGPPTVHPDRGHHHGHDPHLARPRRRAPAQRGDLLRPVPRHQMGRRRPRPGLPGHPTPGHAQHRRPHPENRPGRKSAPPCANPPTTSTPPAGPYCASSVPTSRASGVPGN
jgi:hypothetical protein